MKVLDVISERCTGCRLCEQWCALNHEGEAEGKTRIQISRIHHDYVNIPKVCRQCEDAPCIANCRFDALSKDVVSGAVIVNLELCMGCKVCMRFCNYDAIKYNRLTGKVRICDLCEGNPQCVVHCPEGALEYNLRELCGSKKKTSKGLWIKEGVDDRE